MIGTEATGKKDEGVGCQDEWGLEQSLGGEKLPKKVGKKVAQCPCD